MEHRDWKNSLQETAGRHASRRGAFSAGLTALAVAAVLVFNLLAAQLPEQWAQIDLTGSGIYNISETSQDYLAGLEDDVVIHVLTDKDTLDTRIVRFLDIYADLSDHLTLEYTDPTVYPSALSQYGVGADTIVVTCEATGRQESFDISDIIGYDMMSYYYYGTYTETDFDGEPADLRHRQRAHRRDPDGVRDHRPQRDRRPHQREGAVHAAPHVRGAGEPAHRRRHP